MANGTPATATACAALPLWESFTLVACQAPCRRDTPHVMLTHGTQTLLLRCFCVLQTHQWRRDRTKKEKRESLSKRLDRCVFARVCWAGNQHCMVLYQTSWTSCADGRQSIPTPRKSTHLKIHTNVNIFPAKVLFEKYISSQKQTKCDEWTVEHTAATVNSWRPVRG